MKLIKKQIEKRKDDGLKMCILQKPLAFANVVLLQPSLLETEVIYNKFFRKKRNMTHSHKYVVSEEISKMFTQLSQNIIMNIIQTALRFPL